MKNPLFNILKDKNILHCGWLHIPNTWTAEIMANAGWDALVVDMQHGFQNEETSLEMIQSISTTNTIPLARCQWNSPSSIMKLLDQGAYGIICPMIESASDCKDFVGACKYPPKGYRSFGPTRPRVVMGENYAETANHQIMTFAMIETSQALKNIESIAAVEGLSGIFVGTGDLKLSLTGSLKSSIDNSLFEDALDTILKTCEKYKLIPGIWCPNPEATHKSIQKGFRLVATQSDSMILCESTLKLIKNLKK